jgi:hypothetical protein
VILVLVICPGDSVLITLFWRKSSLHNAHPALSVSRRPTRNLSIYKVSIDPRRARAAAPGANCDTTVRQGNGGL